MRIEGFDSDPEALGDAAAAGVSPTGCEPCPSANGYGLRLSRNPDRRSVRAHVLSEGEHLDSAALWDGPHREGSLRSGVRLETRVLAVFLDPGEDRSVLGRTARLVIHANSQNGRPRKEDIRRGHFIRYERAGPPASMAGGLDGQDVRTDLQVLEFEEGVLSHAPMRQLGAVIIRQNPARLRQRGARHSVEYAAPPGGPSPQDDHQRRRSGLNLHFARKEPAGLDVQPRLCGRRRVQLEGPVCGAPRDARV